MKLTYLSAVTCIVLGGAFLPAAFANHRTGTLVLPEVIVSGDFNEDGNLDIAANSAGFDNVAILLGDGQGKFTLSGHIASDTLPKGLTVGDVDRDGHLDLVQCNNWGYNAVVHLGDGLGGFGERDVVVNAEGGPTRVVLADFNRDRNLDMAVVGPDEGVILIYLSNGKGGFILPPKEIGGLRNNREIIVADFNGDKIPDIATALDTGPQVFLGDGTGGFALSSTLPNSRDAAALGAIDLNKDGKMDLIAVGTGPGPGSKFDNYVDTYLGDGAGGFVLQQHTPLGLGDIRGEIAVADLNGDGNSDVAIPLGQIFLPGRRHREPRRRALFAFGIAATHGDHRRLQ